MLDPIAQVPPQSLYSGPWTPMLITALFAGIAVIIGAATTGIIKIMGALGLMREAQKKSDEKVDSVDGKVDVVHDLVNHQREVMEKEIAALKGELMAGKAADVAAVAEMRALRLVIEGLNVTAAREEGKREGELTSIAPQSVAGVLPVPSASGQPSIPVVVVNPPEKPVPTTDMT